jgi:hypothetical protein
MADLERQMWALVNRDRSDPATSAETGGRARPLRWNEKLAAVARAHSRNMLEQRFFAHVEPDGRTLSRRIDEAGIPWQAAGENIAIDGTVQGAQGAFMNEPRFESNHRANILNANYTDVGIGIVQGPNGSLYITQDFVATPPKLASATPRSGAGGEVEASCELEEPETHSDLGTILPGPAGSAGKLPDPWRGITGASCSWLSQETQKGGSEKC